MPRDSYLNWLENTSENCLDTLFPFGNTLYKFSLYKGNNNKVTLTSLKIRNADFIYANSGVFDSYFVPTDKIAQIISDIDYNDAQVVVGEFNSMKSAKRFVNKRIANYLNDPEALPQSKEGPENLSDEDLVIANAEAMTYLNQKHAEDFSDKKPEKEESNSSDFFQSRLFSLPLEDEALDGLIIKDQVPDILEKVPVEQEEPKEVPEMVEEKNTETVVEDNNETVIDNTPLKNEEVAQEETKEVKEETIEKEVQTQLPLNESEGCLEPIEINVPKVNIEVPSDDNLREKELEKVRILLEKGVNIEILQSTYELTFDEVKSLLEVEKVEEAIKVDPETGNIVEVDDMIDMPEPETPEVVETKSEHPEVVKTEPEDDGFEDMIASAFLRVNVEEAQENKNEVVDKKPEEVSEKVEEVSDSKVEEPKVVEAQPEEPEPVDILQDSLDEIEYSIPALKPTGVVFGVFDDEEDFGL